MKYFLLYFSLITCISLGYSQKYKTISGPVFQEFGYVFPIEGADLLLDKDKKYKGKELNDIKGDVISDYQNYLEELLIQELRDKHKVVINKSEKRKLKKLNL